MEKKEYTIKIDPLEFGRNFETKIEHIRAICHAIYYSADKPDTNSEMVESLGEMAEGLANDLLGYLYQNFAQIVNDFICIRADGKKTLSPTDEFCATIEAGLSGHS